MVKIENNGKPKNPLNIKIMINNINKYHLWNFKCVIFYINIVNNNR